MMVVVGEALNGCKLVKLQLRFAVGGISSKESGGFQVCLELTFDLILGRWPRKEGNTYLLKESHILFCPAAAAALARVCLRCLALST